jgi:Zn-dependent protease
MSPTGQGSLRLFRLAGIDVFLHWSWFVVAVFAVQVRRGMYSSLVWNALEYLSLFFIVLLHEFGHALACRSVGGQAHQIVLWPLGGVAYVSPPPRPGATLWSIAAGPLVNVMLVPVLSVLAVLAGATGSAGASDISQLIRTIWVLNFIILVFNLLPIYPLDGGQILRSLLWFVLGRARSLMVAAIVGFAGVAVMIVVALWVRDIWIGIMAVFILLNCWAGLLHARVLAKAAKLPRRDGFACPACKEKPIIGPFWLCNRCRARFDIFETRGSCPNCGEQFPVIQCLDCGQSRPIGEWVS